MPKAVLSGLEIADAVKRQNEFRKLRTKALTRSGLVIPEELGLFDRMRYWWLSRQPRLYIQDFDPTPSHLGGPCNPNSYNVKLHPEMLVYNVKCLPDALLHTPQFEAVNEYALDMAKDNPTKKLIIPSTGLTLLPGRLYLGRTTERIESYNLRPCIEGRSSTGRLGIAVTCTAGYCDVGFTGTLTLEITVVHPVVVYPNVHICQLDFATISTRHIPYQSKKYSNQVDATASKLFTELNKPKP